MPLTGNNVLYDRTGAAHVAGLNFGRPGELQRCVGCHAGHTMIAVPDDPAEAQFSNLAPGAVVTTSSIDPALADRVGVRGLIDRRVHMELGNDEYVKYWISDEGQDPTDQWVQLTFPVPVTVRNVRLYDLPDPQLDVHDATVTLYSDTDATAEVGSANSGQLSDQGTDVLFDDVLALSISC